MFETILINLETIGMVFLLFSLCVLANIFINTYNNVENLKQCFELKRLLCGIKKMICIGISTALLSIVASAIPYIPILGNMFETQELKEAISFLIIIGLYARAIVKYFKIGRAHV